jgi:hypothetical protein
MVGIDAALLIDPGEIEPPGFGRERTPGGSPACGV